ncbi:MazG nucleotide pyrophosphohydrolase domain-containing protein [Paludifilum halophilum]|uniref:DUF1573 domain-containing protein n=1 Tax=Paludifilum halophilum TaxID=1642702 RepID=A0A235B2Q6_9BACL|nr:MazG nucleotide pyrophosphohydrolase domain-containing protein [Paludifilum halophilum]OYD06564.1 DUF1573 domain-containing protein [Paludifilum halophilum]
MGQESLQAFQHQVGDVLLRHRSFLDVSSKYQESNGRVNRAITKAVTECGCLRIEAGCQPFEEAIALSEMKNRFDTHLTGHLCDHCLDTVKEELGKNLFYMTALCNLLDIKVEEVIEKESKKLSTLGIFNLR